MKKILQLDEEVFFDSHLDMTDASVWLRPALRSTIQKKNQSHKGSSSHYFSYQKLFTLINFLSLRCQKKEKWNNK